MTLTPKLNGPTWDVGAFHNMRAPANMVLDQCMPNDTWSLGGFIEVGTQIVIFRLSACPNPTATQCAVRSSCPDLTRWA